MKFPLNRISAGYTQKRPGFVVRLSIALDGHRDRVRLHDMIVLVCCHTVNSSQLFIIQYTSLTGVISVFFDYGPVALFSFTHGMYGRGSCRVLTLVQSRQRHAFVGPSMRTRIRRDRFLEEHTENGDGGGNNGSRCLDGSPNGELLAVEGKVPLSELNYIYAFDDCEKIGVTRM